MECIERVEVIKGPASTLYGSEAVGGVINIITKKHPNKPTGSIQVEGGLQQHSEYGNSWGTSAYASTPIIDDVLSFGLRFGYYTKEQNDLRWSGVEKEAQEIEKIYGGPGEYKNLNFGVRLNYSMNENNHFYFDYDHITNETNSKKAAASRAMPWRKGIDKPVGVRSFYYKTQKDNFVLNHDGNYNWGSTNSYLQYNHMYGSGDFKGFDSKIYTAESKVVLPFDLGSWGDFITTFGVRFDKEELKDRKVNHWFSSFDGTKSQKNLAVYAENEWLITDDLIFTTGLRYLYNDIFGSELIPRVYLVYHANDYLTLKGGVAKGYKTPSPRDLVAGINLVNSDGINVGNPDLVPESSTNYELGMNINIPEIMNISLTGFVTDFKDEIRSDRKGLNGQTIFGYQCTDAFTCSRTVNLNKTQTKGIEIGINTAKFNGFSFDASYTYIDKKNKTSGKNYGDVIGDVPRQVAMAKLNYEIGDFSAFFRARARLDHINTGRQSRYFPKYKDFYAFDLGMQYKIAENHTINFVVNNLFDKEYIEPVKLDTKRNGFGAMVTTYANQYNDFTDRRNFWLSYRYDF